MALTFKEKHTFDARLKEVLRVRAKYPRHLPVVVEGAGKGIPELKQKKYLVSMKLTMGELMFVLRKRMQVEASQALYLMVGNYLPASTALVTQVYEQHKESDGYLYLTYRAESAFG
jgi:GABA(A) receptor-associated protein